MENKRKGRRIELPLMQTTFPVKRNPLHDSHEVRKMCELTFEFSCMSAENYRKIEDICLFGAYFFPFVEDMEKYLNLGRIMQLFFILDDHNECEWADVARESQVAEQMWEQVDLCFQRLIEGNQVVSMVNWKPYIVLLHIGFEEIFRRFSDDQKKRMATAFHEWGVGNIEEANLINEERSLATIDQYLEVRKLSIGAKPVFAMIEYADGLHLTDNEWEDPLLVSYMEHGAFLVVLANDYQSIEKELNENNGRPKGLMNATALIMEWNKCSVEKALVKLVDIFNDYENRTKQIQTQLLNRTDIRDELKMFIDRVEYVIGGNLRAGLLLKRYCEVSEIDQ